MTDVSNVKIAQAADLIQAELPKYLGNDIVFTQISGDTFVDDHDEELSVIFVSFKTDRRPLDPRALIDFHSKTRDRFLEMGFARPPAISYDDQPLTAA